MKWLTHFRYFNNNTFFGTLQKTDEKESNIIMWSQKNHVIKRRFPNYFDFTLSFFKALSQDGQIINLKNILVIFLHIFYNIQKDTFVHSFTKRFEILAAANTREKPWSSSAKTEQWLISPGKPKAIDNMHSLYDLSN